jgi:hypothetical protein
MNTTKNLMGREAVENGKLVTMAKILTAAVIGNKPDLGGVSGEIKP